MRFTPLLLLALLPGSASAADVPPFRSVELRNGGEVEIRHGPAQSVDIEGATGARVAVAGGQLIVEPCAKGCRHGERHRIIVTTPVLDGLSVSEGGTARTVGVYPAQAKLATAVRSGGTVDARSVPAANVAASVDSGGRILVRPTGSLTAAVSDGGNVTYWGDPRVTRSISRRGVIERGEPGDADRPLSDPEMRGVSPVPPIPPVPPRSR